VSRSGDIIHIEALKKEYHLGAEIVYALRGVELDIAAMNTLP
jgi:hypothetical protein